jgi:uncharacterized protein (DUF1778 family)
MNPSSQTASAKRTADEARTPVKDSRINLRITSRQEHIIRRAAAITDRTMTDFVLESAARHAEEVLADRRWFVLSDDEWAAFEHALEAPLAHTSALRQLLTERREIDLSDL